MIRIDIARASAARHPQRLEVPQSAPPCSHQPSQRSPGAHVSGDDANAPGSFPVRERVLRLKDVITQVGLSRSTIYAKKQHGTFPEPVKLGVRAVGWLQSDVDIWLGEQVKKARHACGRDDE